MVQWVHLARVFLKPREVELIALEPLDVLELVSYFLSVLLPLLSA